MKTKRSHGKFEENKESLNVANLFIAIKEVFVSTKVKMEKMHGLRYVATKRRNVNK